MAGAGDENHLHFRQREIISSKRGSRRILKSRDGLSAYSKMNPHCNRTNHLSQ